MLALVKAVGAVGNSDENLSFGAADVNLKVRGAALESYRGKPPYAPQQMKDSPERVTV